ncbi:hypothetical protein PP301_gp101 [Gordonia phage GMA2]|uniref:Uncharacterized protein n=1 Tax=Gordonia phage GMA2 TaxID=1647283 RepID=A0A0K0N7H8_9CAUD|nr:hypothetical protein PP301_gp101 [Gordonia phage GMA2]AKJ72621.1 hypothetical protein GMA2_83 [Gordonia phage GMA2]
MRRLKMRRRARKIFYARAAYESGDSVLGRSLENEIRAELGQEPIRDANDSIGLMQQVSTAWKRP